MSVLQDNGEKCLRAWNVPWSSLAANPLPTPDTHQCKGFRFFHYFLQFEYSAPTDSLTGFLDGSWWTSVSDGIRGLWPNLQTNFDKFTKHWLYWKVVNVGVGIQLEAACHWRYIPWRAFVLVSLYMSFPNTA